MLLFELLILYRALSEKCVNRGNKKIKFHWWLLKIVLFLAKSQVKSINHVKNFI